MDVLIWALKILLAGLVLMPVVGTTGCAFINHWWAKQLEYQKRMLEIQMRISAEMWGQSGKDG